MIKDRETNRPLDAILTAILVFFSGCSSAQTWSWSAPTEDINGNALSRDNLYFKLYWGYDNSEWYFSTDYNETSVDLSGVAAGCYYLYVSAVRTDTDPELESEPSESVHFCSAVELGQPNPPGDSQLDG